MKCPLGGADMPSPECAGWKHCEASICPEDRESLTAGRWFPDEGVCVSRRYSSLPWVRRQKAIAKLAKRYDIDGCFTRKMLEAVVQVRRGIEGASPNRQGSEAAWLRTRSPQMALPLALKVPGSALAKNNGLQNHTPMPSRVRAEARA